MEALGSELNGPTGADPNSVDCGDGAGLASIRNYDPGSAYRIHMEGSGKKNIDRNNSKLEGKVKLRRETVEDIPTAVTFQNWPLPLQFGLPIAEHEDPG